MRERQLQAFRAVMDFGGINRAAEMMKLSQPAVSRLISGLEASTGLVLFERSGRSVRPTPEAEELRREVDAFFIGLDRLANAAKEIRELGRGHLRLSVMPALALSVVPGIVRRFSEQVPAARTTLDVHASPRIGELIASAQFDIGLGHLTGDWPEIEVLGAWSVRCVCVMSVGHRLADRTELTPSDLDGEAFVALSSRTATADWVDQAFLQEGVRPVVRVQAQPSWAACRLAAEGLGIAIVDPLTAKVFATEGMRTVPLSRLLPFEFKLMRPARTRASLLSDAFVEVALQQLDELLA